MEERQCCQFAGPANAPNAPTNRTIIGNKCVARVDMQKKLAQKTKFYPFFSKIDVGLFFEVFTK